MFYFTFIFIKYYLVKTETKKCQLLRINDLLTLNNIYFFEVTSVFTWWKYDSIEQF